MRIRWIVFLVLCAGCAPGVTKMNQDRDYQAAVTAESRGNWDIARKAWARVIANSQSSGATARQQAVYHYEYGRSLGVTCHFEEAERELLEAYRLDVETDGPAYMSLTELARLNLDQSRFTEATIYFERMLNEVDEKVLREAPIGYADILDEFATALAATGQNGRAAKMRSESLEIRSAHPQGHPIIERTPYASQCH